MPSWCGEFRKPSPHPDPLPSLGGSGEGMRGWCGGFNGHFFNREIIEPYEQSRIECRKRKVGRVSPLRAAHRTTRTARTD
jgi:hypothetical protein